jgi:hypothetical protein
MSKTTDLSPELQEWAKDWITGLTESGTMEELMSAFAKELLPYAAAAARRAQQQRLNPDAEVVLVKLRPFLAGLADTMERMTLNPDVMAASTETWRDLSDASIELNNWIRFIDEIEIGAGEAAVHPSAEIVMRTGGVQ